MTERQTELTVRLRALILPYHVIILIQILNINLMSFIIHRVIKVRQYRTVRSHELDQAEMNEKDRE